jgi:hypothetical protein
MTALNCWQGSRLPYSFDSMHCYHMVAVHVDHQALVERMQCEATRFQTSGGVFNLQIALSAPILVLDKYAVQWQPCGTTRGS